MTTTTKPDQAERDPRLEEGSFWQQYKQRVRTGDLGSAPIVLGLIVIWVIFYLLEDRFLSARNLSNLMLQIAAIGTISVGVVLVLLLGEIDLSVGAVSGLAAAVMAVLNVKQGWPAAWAILAGVAVGAVIGTFNGFIVTRLKVPSFVVTLAGLLAFQGALLYVLGGTGTVNLRDETITGLAGTFFSPTIGWVLAAIVVGAAIGGLVLDRRERAKAGLPPTSLANRVFFVLLVVIAVFGATGVLNADRGVPLAVLIFLGFVVFFDLLTRRTRFGRYIFSVGGNTEASRRAGIKVETVRTIVFTLTSTMAAVGGIMAASRLLAVNQSSGAGTVLLNAIAAAVIGGTSLFGGRGSVWSALLGALVIGSISNGMDLLALSSSIKLMITGAVLLIAVIIDSTARRGQPAAR